MGRSLSESSSDGGNKRSQMMYNLRYKEIDIFYILHVWQVINNVFEDFSMITLLAVVITFCCRTCRTRGGKKQKHCFVFMLQN